MLLLSVVLEVDVSGAVVCNTLGRPCGTLPDGVSSDGGRRICNLSAL